MKRLLRIIGAAFLFSGLLGNILLTVILTRGNF